MSKMVFQRPTARAAILFERPSHQRDCRRCFARRTRCGPAFICTPAIRLFSERRTLLKEAIMTHYDDDDAFENGVLRDRARRRVPMYMRDS